MLFISLIPRLVPSLGGSLPPKVPGCLRKVCGGVGWTGVGWWSRPVLVLPFGQNVSISKMSEFDPIGKNLMW